MASRIVCSVPEPPSNYVFAFILSPPPRLSRRSSTGVVSGLHSIGARHPRLGARQKVVFGEKSTAFTPPPFGEYCLFYHREGVHASTPAPLRGIHSPFVTLKGIMVFMSFRDGKELSIVFEAQPFSLIKLIGYIKGGNII